jgi:alpha-glucosidase
MYYGEELGMQNVPIPFEEVQDPAERNEPGLGLGRDPERTPMPWDASMSAGFTTGQPWLPLGSDHRSVNVEALEIESDSILHLYRTLIALRRSRPILVSGALTSLTVEKSALSYQRTSGPERIAVLLNMAADPVDMTVESGMVLVSTHSKRGAPSVSGRVELQGNEGLIVALD